ncbi:nickel ABC transporter ATP-binding protein NikE [Paenibacillus puerhi]|uniref:nickel ABC transporter ATP-binding protein NikE n=1 Tax=Paenibacillus puerhi TaxID=2692622 RepID=UPI0013597778|nr:ABC transporter ATP-binding protein [Paenibacillus puerhi]
MPNKEQEPMLRVRSLQVSYKQNQQSIPILKNLSFELRKGEVLAVLGESGSGKSTMAKAVTGLLPPSAIVGGGSLEVGSLRIGDLSDSGIPWKQVRGRRIAMLFQDARLALNPVLRIQDHFRESLLYHRLASADEVLSVSARLLSLLGFADAPAILSSYPFQLSGGMCQRVCLALALSLKPSVLIADEPTSALDTVSQREVLDCLERMQRELGLTVLLITHDIAVARAVSHRVMVLRRGVIEEEGDTRSVLSRPRTAYTRRLLAARAQLARPSRDRKMPPLSASGPLLEVIGLNKSFHPSKPILQDIHLALNPKEIVGILGQSGCGKSTLARCIAGLESPGGGRVLIRGNEISGLKGRARRDICKRIQLVFQEARASLNPGRTALQLVQEPLHYLHIGTRREREAMARLYLHEVGITGDALSRRPPQLSTGQCQRIAIARALVLKPEILICDEAVSALDMNVQAHILALLQRLHKQYGFSMIMISHDIRVLRSFCHRIAVMNEGSFCEVRQADDLLQESNQPYTQLLLKCAGDMEEGF